MSENDKLLLEKGKLILEENGIENASFDAKCMLDFAKTKKLNDEEFLAMCKKRASFYPLQYIIKSSPFYELDLACGEGCLIPREDTLSVVLNVIENNKTKNNLKCIDLCAGSGAIAIYLAYKMKALVYAIELFDEAYKYLLENINFYKDKLLGKITPMQMNVLTLDTSSYFYDVDIIVSNPPYLTKEDMQNLQNEVKFEPTHALFGGDDGLKFYRYIIENYKDCLKSSGQMYFEIDEKLKDKVESLFLKHGFTNIEIYKDLSNSIRAIKADKI